MMLNTKSRYAIMAMVYLSTHAETAPHTLAEISESQDIPLSYLEQIFLILRKQGLVKSVRGPGGGYALAAPAPEVPISAIVMAVEEPLKMTRCDSEKREGCLHDKTRCLTHNLWAGLENVIYNYFSAITLADVSKHQLTAITNPTTVQPIGELANA